MSFGEFMKASPMKMLHSVVERGPYMLDEIRRSLFWSKKNEKNDREGPTNNEENRKENKNNKDDITNLLNSLQKVEMGQHAKVLNTNRGDAEHGAMEKIMDMNVMMRKTPSKPVLTYPTNP